MTRLPLIFTCLFFLIQSTYAQDIEVYDDFETFRSKLIQDPSKVYVVNYWATWCAPCIKELPYFEELNRKHESKGIEVVLVSIDFKNQYESKLMPFVRERKLQSRVIHMADRNSNQWIDKVDPDWSGAIPITLFISGDNELFMERSFSSYVELKSELDKYLSTIQ